MKKQISILLCLLLLISLIPLNHVFAYNATSLGTIESGQIYYGTTPLDDVGNHVRVRYEMPITQDSMIRIIVYTQTDGDSSIAIDSPNSPYESATSFGSFTGSNLTSINDFYYPAPDVFSTSCYGATADTRNTNEYTEVFGTLAKGTYYLVVTGATYRFKVIIEPLKYQGDNSNPNATRETASTYTIGTNQQGVLIPNGIVNGDFINYEKMMNSWYKFTGKAGKYSLTFATDGFFQGTCSVLGSDGYPVDGTERKVEAFFEFNNEDKLGGTYEEHLAKAKSYTLDFELLKDGTYYININRRSWTDGSYQFSLNYNSGTGNTGTNTTGNTTTGNDQTYDNETGESEITLSTISVSPADASIKAGTTMSFQATAYYSDYSSEDMTEFVTWTSSNKKVATVDEQGNVKGVGAGKATITASLEGKVQSASITVVADIVMKKIVPAKATVYLKVGATATNKITAYFSDGTKKSVTSNVTYQSSSDSLKISKTGLMKASKKGSYTITATYEGKKATFKVVVK